jgi:phosphoribosyl-ATP pyrophosphohydrolase/phosphoribosyl-AMP cyclohydrolase
VSSERRGDAPLRLEDSNTLNFDKGRGLLTAVVQHARDGSVLMVGYMNRDAFRETLTRGRVVFYSRTKGRLWEKGETSGNSLDVVEVRADCDRDALLITALPRGPVCHLGTDSCFGDEPAFHRPLAAAEAPAPTRAASPVAADAGARVAGPAGTNDAAAHPLAFLASLEAIIEKRVAERPEGSYTARLFSQGPKRIAQKVGEEGVEVALAAVTEGDDKVLSESADLLYHLLVLLRSRGLPLARVVAELESRHAR